VISGLWSCTTFSGLIDFAVAGMSWRRPRTGWTKWNFCQNDEPSIRQSIALCAGPRMMCSPMGKSSMALFIHLRGLLTRNAAPAVFPWPSNGTGSTRGRNRGYAIS
jgi:hypothetical protein